MIDNYFIIIILKWDAKWKKNLINYHQIISWKWETSQDIIWWSIEHIIQNSQTCKWAKERTHNHNLNESKQLIKINVFI